VRLHASARAPTREHVFFGTRASAGRWLATTPHRTTLLLISTRSVWPYILTCVRERTHVRAGLPRVSVLRVFNDVRAAIPI